MLCIISQGKVQKKDVKSTTQKYKVPGFGFQLKVRETFCRKPKKWHPFFQNQECHSFHSLFNVICKAGI